ncbi:MAG: copper resistance protein CopC [Armatimonadota bacterium]|nr:copper resistance protein CopC [Armatimonadota bacterium]
MRARGLLPIVLLTLGLWAASAVPVGAHGVLERSTPPANAVLDRAPDRIVLWFSEPVDPAFSTAVVTSGEGRRYGRRAEITDGGRALAVALEALPRGIYTVRWRVLALSDGHITSGALAFSVGQPLTASVRTVAGDVPGPARVAVRWMGLLAALLLAGLVAFEIWSPVPGPTVIRRAQMGAASVLFLAAVADLLVGSALLFEVPLRDALATGALWPFLVRTKAGWHIVSRAGLAVVALWATVSRGAGRTWPAAQLTSVLASAGALAGVTLGSHGSGRGWLAMAVDWVHLLAVAVWIGGVAGSLMIAWATPPSGRARIIRGLAPRLSAITAVCVGLVVTTGAYGAKLHVAGMQALADSAYGRTLTLKTVLVVVLVAMAVIGRLGVRGWIASTAAVPTVALRRFLGLGTAEVCAGAVIGLVVAVLTLTPPAPPRAGAAVLLSGQADALRILLSIAPAEPGWNRVEVRVLNGNGGSVPTPGRVLVRFVNLDEPTEPTTVVLSALGEGQFAAGGAELGPPGWWEVSVFVRWPGRADAETIFPLHLGEECRPIAGPDALRLLERVREAWASVRTWREIQQLTDGAGNAYLTWLEAERPDRQRFSTSTGVQVVSLGRVRYQRASGGAWKRYEFSSPTPVEGPLYFLRGARGIRLGRTGWCDGEPCRVLFWTSPDGGARFAAWVGLHRYMVSRLLMLEPTHYMTLRYADINVPVRIEPPE